jgi:hypothetical protein
MSQRPLESDHHQAIQPADVYWLYDWSSDAVLLDNTVEVMLYWFFRCFSAFSEPYQHIYNTGSTECAFPREGLIYMINNAITSPSL